MNGKVDYGIDAPGLLKAFLIVGVVALLATAILGSWLGGAGWSKITIALAGIVAAYALGMACFMFVESKFGKVKGREALLDAVTWRGDEQVLDIGCGRGLMLIGAAKRLTTGQAIGVDIWQASDQSENSPEGAIENARSEGVIHRVRVETADMRSLPFANQSFDVITSHWVVHNLEQAADREAALDEMKRVLKPGGTLLLTDIAHRDAYHAYLMDAGFDRLRLIVRPLRDLILAAVSFGSFRPATIVARRST